VNIDPADVAKLNWIQVAVTLVGIFVNLLLLIAISNNAWLEGTALADGQPFLVHVSLGSAIFGPNSDPKANSKYFCDSDVCSLEELCSKAVSPEVFLNGAPKDTFPAEWCAAQRAGAFVGGMLGFGFIPGLAAILFTSLYSAKKITYFAPIFAKAEAMGLKEEQLKYLVAGCWAGLWVFMVGAMVSYAAMIPDSLGWGGVRLEASFGLLRFSMMLISIFGGILIFHMFELWIADKVSEAWTEYLETKFFSAKKALYLQIFIQMGLYLLLTVYMVDWALLLVVIVAYYLDAKVKNFKLIYIVLVSISIIFDTMRYAALPSYSAMTPGESFGNTVWTLIFLLKPSILVTIYFYEKEGEEGFVPFTDDVGRFVDDNDAIAE